jgi:hypothetical protein
MVAGLYVRKKKGSGIVFYFFWRGRGGYFTLRSVTRSAAWRSVRVDMSSTSLCSAGSEDSGGVGVEVSGGGGGDDDGVEVVASAVAVASARVKGLRAETLCVALRQ